jgi:hypothetical protein
MEEEEEEHSNALDTNNTTGQIRVEAVPETGEEVPPNAPGIGEEPLLIQDYARILKAVQVQEHWFPPELRLKVLIAECSISPSGRLMYWDQLWVPSGMNLRARVLQGIHDSTTHIHQGRKSMYAIVAHQFFLPGVSRDIRMFIGACDEYRSNKTWRSKRQGFLKPLLIPSRVWSELSMDFITGLLISEGCLNMVILTDWLSKGVVADGLEDIKAKTVAKWFLCKYYRHYYLPDAIVSDRGTQFMSAFWKRLCDMLQIQCQLSTSFSPETDGSIERANEVVETVLKELVSWAQDDWVDCLHIGVGAINGRNAVSTGVAPFFMTHGWNQEIFKFELLPT